MLREFSLRTNLAKRLFKTIVRYTTLGLLLLGLVLGSVYIEQGPKTTFHFLELKPSDLLFTKASTKNMAVIATKHVRKRNTSRSAEDFPLFARRTGVRSTIETYSHEWFYDIHCLGNEGDVVSFRIVLTGPAVALFKLRINENEKKDVGKFFVPASFPLFFPVFAPQVAQDLNTLAKARIRDSANKVQDPETYIKMVKIILAYFKELAERMPKGKIVPAKVLLGGII